MSKMKVRLCDDKWKAEYDGEFGVIDIVCPDQDALQEVADGYSLIENHGGIDEVERKLQALEEVITLAKTAHFAGSALKNQEAYRQLGLMVYQRLIVHPLLTVGDLKPGKGDRIKLKDSGDSNIYIRPESCANIDEVIERGRVVMMYEKDNSLCLKLKDTPCEKVWGDKF
ncbi:MAG: hypothetical protein GY841_04290 [FCB group bacterium]|nr:hypothetical protein [FCB group bacterium]